MMDQIFIDELSAKEHNKFISSLKDQCIQSVDMSRDRMRDYYGHWEEQQRVYRAWRELDEDDKKALQEGRPRKQVIPESYAKVQTFVSFVQALFFQRARFFQVDPTGMEDHMARELTEKVLDADTKHNKWFNIVGQHAKDIARFGLGVLKHTWTEEMAYISEDVMSGGIRAFGKRIGARHEVIQRPVVKRRGNKIKNVSPFDFYPDPRVALSDFEDGEFCADECDININKLFELQLQGVVAGIEHIVPVDGDRAWYRKRTTLRSRINWDEPDRTEDIVRLTEIQIKLIPNRVKLNDETPLGTGEMPVTYLVWIANDQRVIRIEPMNYLHGKFTYDLAQFDEDIHEFMNMSLTEIMARIQETMDWFLNARVESVTRTIDNQLVVDPLGIDMSTIKNRSRVILLKKGASRTGVERYLMQLKVQDVTQRHMEDIGQLKTINNEATGVNSNAMGQYHTGRRSATEARVVTQGASGRLKSIAQTIWNACYSPCGMKLLTNLRQGLELDDVIRMAGMEFMKPENQIALEVFMAPPEELVKQSDFFIYEGTLQSENSYAAQSLQELFATVVQLGPDGILQTGISPNLLLRKIYELLGIGDLDQFNVARDPQTLQAVVMQLVQQVLMQQQQQQAPNGNGNNGNRTGGSQAPTGAADRFQAQ